MEQVDVISWLLAARHDTAIQGMPEYAEALRMAEADPELAQAVEQERAYYDKHEDYLDFVTMPDGARERIREQLRAAATPQRSLVTFPWRPLAIAASLVVLLAMGLVTLRQGLAPQVAQTVPLTFDSFREFAAEQVEKGFSLDYASTNADAIVHWLADSGVPSELGPGDRLSAFPTMGCKVLDCQGHPVSMVCFRIQDQTVHLFVMRASTLPAQELAQGGGHGVYARRETVSWVDAQNAYVLVAHDPGQALTGFSG